MAELLAPAGSMDGLRASVQNGADAVYLGGRLFGARSSAENFDDLTAAVEYCHLRGVRVHLTVNTLVKDGEFAALDDTIAQAAAAGVDACIVQDISVALRIRETVPGMPLHASTQMALMGRYGASWAREQGFARVIAARECSVQALRDMAREIQTEAFVHGALCVAYSGQCLMSSMIGGRSGNRGRCAQPCRLPWEMDGRQGYRLSTRDLCLLEDIPLLLEAGVSSFKIEGRLRRAEYAAVATKAYRLALDAALEGRDFDSGKERSRLMALFNRGEYTRGYAFGYRDRDIMNAERPNHAGVRVGEVRFGTLVLDDAIQEGDALEIRPEGTGFTAEREWKTGRHPLGRPMPDGEVYRLVDARLMEEARRSFARENRWTDLGARLILHPGRPARLRLGDIEVTGDIVQSARNSAVTEEQARLSIEKFDQLPWRLISFSMEGDGAFLPVSSLNALRRTACDALKINMLERTRSYPMTTQRIGASARTEGYTQVKVSTPALALQATDIAELVRAKGIADWLYYQPLDWRLQALEKDAKDLPTDALVVLPFWLDGDVLDIALSAFDRAAGFVAGSPAHLGRLMGRAVVADFSLHSMNRRSVRAWRELGAARATLSPELTLGEMRLAARQGETEMIVYGRLPLMTLRHCPASATHGCPGKEACALPASMTDRKREDFAFTRVIAQDGCRVQILNAHVLSGLRDVDKLKTAGCGVWRVMGGYDDLLSFRGALDGKQPEIDEDQKWTRGHWFRGVE